jgi:hypothetical protein
MRRCCDYHDYYVRRPDFDQWAWTKPRLNHPAYVTETLS